MIITFDFDFLTNVSFEPVNRKKINGRQLKVPLKRAIDELNRSVVQKLWHYNWAIGPKIYHFFDKKSHF